MSWLLLFSFSISHTQYCSVNSFRCHQRRRFLLSCFGVPNTANWLMNKIHRHHDESDEQKNNNLYRHISWSFLFFFIFRFMEMVFVQLMVLDFYNKYLCVCNEHTCAHQWCSLKRTKTIFDIFLFNFFLFRFLCACRQYKISNNFM